MPIRVQRKRTKGYRLPPNTVCVTRPGKFGNPYETASVFRFWLEMSVRFPCNPDTLKDPLLKRMMTIARDLEQLRGKNLACFCGEDRECHADVLLEFANR